MFINSTLVTLCFVGGLIFLSLGFLIRGRGHPSWEYKIYIHGLIYLFSASLFFQYLIESFVLMGQAFLLAMILSMPTVAVIDKSFGDRGEPKKKKNVLVKTPLLIGVVCMTLFREFGFKGLLVTLHLFTLLNLLAIYFKRRAFFIRYIPILASMTFSLLAYIGLHFQYSDIIGLIFLFITIFSCLFFVENLEGK